MCRFLVDVCLRQSRHNVLNVIIYFINTVEHRFFIDSKQLLLTGRIRTHSFYP